MLATLTENQVTKHMNRSSVIKGLTVVLLLFIFVFSAVACIDWGNNNGNNENQGGENGDSTVDKAALEAEIASAVTAQGDYTADSFSAYQAKLADAKTVAANENATQNEVDKAASDLKAARLALAIRPVEAVKGANREIRIASGETKEITLADYINVNGLSKITYKVQSSNELLSLGTVSGGKFTVTAGEVEKETTVKLSINVYYDNAAKLSVELTVKVFNGSEPYAVKEEFVKECNLVELQNKDYILLDFSENIHNYGGFELSYAAKYGNEDLTLDGTSYSFALGEYGEEATYETFTVTVSYELNGATKTIEYTYKLAIRDTGAYSVVNGSFDNGLDGWTFINTLGEAPFAGIDNKTIYWVQQFPMNNVGSYFSAYADGAAEASQGTLASSYFIANSEYATFMMGGAGNPNVYITIENKSGEVLALYRNTMFADLPEDLTDFDAQRQLVGVSVFLCNFVTYKVDLTEWAGETVRFVVHDHASEGWGVVFFDELVTYYGAGDELPEGAILAENLLADKSALSSELSREITEQGDYTLDSYNAYLKALADAKALVNDIAVTQTTVNEATATLISAREGLEVRSVYEVEGATKSLRLTSGNGREIVISDFVNANGVAGLSYTVKTNSSLITVSEVADGKFSVTAAEVSENTSATVSIIVSYGDREMLVVDLAVQITNDLAPTVLVGEINAEYDVYTLDNKGYITLNLAQNVDNAGNLALTYSVNGVAISGSTYSFALASYTDKPTVEALTVSVSYTANGQSSSVSYTYKLSIKDTTANRLENGGFENGLEGWNVVGNIGNVNSDSHYWLNDPENADGYAFGMDGDKMFSAYAPGALESAVGTLTSSTFKVGGSGFISFKVGAMRDENYVYIDVVDANTKQILARYYNGLWADRTDDIKSGCTLIAYKADLSAFMGREVFFRISDNADSGYGLFFADSFITYYDSEPDGFNYATPVSYTLPNTVYDVFNGDFEMGDVQGWWNIGEIGVVTNANGYWGENISYGKHLDYLFTGVESFEADTMREHNRGTLTSSAFELGGTGYISFMLGGGENLLCYVQVIDAVTGEILGRYHQQHMDGAVLQQYVADLSQYIGRTVRVQVVDQASEGWGCVSFDNLVTYYASKTDLPVGTLATDIKGEIKYTIDNGSFESGNLDGWTMNITEEGVHNTLGWVLDSEIDVEWYTKNDDTKDGRYLLTFVQPDDTNCESSKGTLQSSTFTLKKDSYVSFKFGGAGTRGVHIQLCRADGSVIATFYNEAEGKINTEMFSYYYQYGGDTVECFFRVVDNEASNYGCFVVDDFRVNLDSAPEGYIAAIQ